jgi:hypothetical protein
VRTYDLTGNEGTAAIGAYTMMVSDLLASPVVHTGHWQAMDTSKSKSHGTHELEDVSIVIDPLPKDLDAVAPFIDHSWADDHFLERVSGKPLNPAPSHVDWPYAVGGNTQHIGNHAGVAERFDHTYPERFWPRFAGDMAETALIERSTGRHSWKDPVSGITTLTPASPTATGEGMRGIYFRYGDLSDVVDLIVRHPLTRQAYLPVWFPEDTGAHQGQRVPCTLGYHFMVRGGKMSCRYYLRSCDVYRHFSNDVYFAAKLTRWLCDQVNDRINDEPSFTEWGSSPLSVIRPSRLVMHISSLHAFENDGGKIMRRIETHPS